MRHRPPYFLAPLALLYLAAGGVGYAQTAATPATTPPPAANKKADYTCEAELLLAIRINGVPRLDCEHIATLSNGRLAANAEALRHWRLRIPPVEPILYEGENYYPLDAIPGLHYQLDEAAQELQLEIPASAFESSSFNLTAGLQRRPHVSPGGFFNYDLLTQQSTNSQNINGQLEAGVFNQQGVGTTTVLWRNRGTPHNFTRLETAWTHDDPESISRFQLGDNISRAGTWGRAIRFGGLQWRSNFDTQPGFVTFPQPSATGIAALPSTVDVYVNNARRTSQAVQSGPFEISNVPVITGAGEVQLVVTDLLGRQQIISQPYYASPSMLREGLSDHSYEIGFDRQDYSLLSNRYGKPFTTATHRYGISNRFTRELRAEVLASQQTAGMGGVYLWPSFGTAQTAVAASHSPDGNGALFMAGIEQVSRKFSWSVQEQISSPRFTELSWVSGNVRPRSTQSLRLGFPLGEQGGSLSLNHVNQQYWGQPGNRIWSVNYSRNLFREFYLLLYATRSASGASSNRTIGFNISYSFGDRTSASAQYNRQNAGNDRTLQVQKNLPEGAGFGYRVLAQEGLSRREEANGSWQTDHGTYTAGASQTPNDSTTRLGASGGIAFLGGSTFASRRIDGSFAVVDTGGYPDVRVYHENRPVGTTDSKGQALIPHLRPYQLNRISIEQEDLPIEAQVEQLELQITPALRSGTVAEFPIKKTRGGTLVIVLEDGSFIPSGATVMMLDHEEEYPIGQRGEVFLPDLSESNELLVNWKGKGCQINIKLPPDSPPLADLGKYTCEGVLP
ncbi:fimbriae usher protein [Ferrigenium kumadai]|uniref:Fimbriae usher protein n=1 Tax=Ferrigenium kumadai TaxID=1682490 RepID=A0AAN1SYA8_9PROT|nr:fimbria/pilus outer membrane usher protein [Ferrigenium kumadai]BBI99207.1 fimbriae usher protein [Ferrigenium kumadai]